MDELIKNELLGDLYAYYGPLLTNRQRSYFEDYYYNDLSLGEIAANHAVSRQAVYDNLRRSSEALLNYESKLHLQKEYHELIKQLVLVNSTLNQQDPALAQKQITTLLTKLRGE